MDMKAYKQQGLSSLGLLFVLGLAAFLLMCGLKVIPIYIDGYFVSGSLNKLHDVNLEEMTNRQIRNKIGRQFSVDSVYDLSPRDVKIERVKGRVILSLDYERRVNFSGNLDVAVSFKHRIDSQESPQ